MADEDTGLVGTRTQSHRARQCAADEAMLRWCFSDRFFTVNLFTTRRRILNSTATFLKSIAIAEMAVTSQKRRVWESAVSLQDLSGRQRARLHAHVDRSG